MKAQRREQRESICLSRKSEKELKKALQHPNSISGSIREKLLNEEKREIFLKKQLLSLKILIHISIGPLPEVVHVVSPTLREQIPKGKTSLESLTVEQIFQIDSFATKKF